MKKDRILLLLSCAVAGVAILCMLRHNAQPSFRSYSKELQRTGDSVQEYYDNHGTLPGTLADLDDPQLSSVHGLPVVYRNNVTNFTVSLKFPGHINPMPNLPYPTNAPGGRLVSSEMTMSYGIEK